MLSDDEIQIFLEEGPQPEKAPEEMPEKPMYTRAEVDEIVQRSIKSTLEALQGTQQNEPETPAESEVSNEGTEGTDE